MKKLFAAVLIIMLVCGLTACSGAAGTGNGAHSEIDAASEAEKQYRRALHLKRRKLKATYGRATALPSLKALYTISAVTAKDIM